ncbi:RNA/RNP complex-1-interacting phosphatase homolog [Anopheles moucheti]|uniref:RNA/RNP complex-1-interacting phosphatase homolog n=1 Tax=Anopheles moucheti TaxID=186751 RepID=UPI0022F02B52|nr:RNA/RNP complex-1-interacting phosphatase homolog [Anopheles moucheti]
MRGSIPDRWLAYSCYGRTLINKFVALKVPLSSRRTAVPSGMRFTPEDAVKLFPFGLIIDLTNTNRYYDPHDFTSRGVDHVKVAVPGKQTPSERIVKRFNDVVNGFLNDPNSNGKLIGVHCTHGLNRTGYLVCAYMILELGYNPMDAINLFNDYRGHNMERPNYLQSLRSMVPRRNAGGPRGHGVVPRRHDIQSWRLKKRSPSCEVQGRAVRAQERINWRQDRTHQQHNFGPRRDYVEARQQHGPRPYDRAQYRYDDNYHRNSQRSPDHGERYDPAIRRVVRSREHNFRTPAHRHPAAHEKVKHIRFE